MFVDQNAYAAAKASRADLMTAVRDAVDGDAKSRDEIEADAHMAAGDLDRVLAADYITLEQAHEILAATTDFESLDFTVTATAPA